MTNIKKSNKESGNTTPKQRPQWQLDKLKEEPNFKFWGEWSGEGSEPTLEEYDAMIGAKIDAQLRELRIHRG